MCLYRNLSKSLAKASGMQVLYSVARYIPTPEGPAPLSYPQPFLHRASGCRLKPPLSPPLAGRESKDLSYSDRLSLAKVPPGNRPLSHPSSPSYGAEVLLKGLDLGIPSG